MARIRTIKPEFFTSEDIVSISPLARLLYIATWCEADKEGRLAWKPMTFKLRYFPGDACDIKALCDELVSSGLVLLYGDGLAVIPAFSKHQHVNPRESASVLPEPDASPRVATRQVPCESEIDPQVGREGKGRESNSDASRQGGFEEFWEAYPSKKAKPAALKAFRVAKINGHLPLVLAHIGVMASSEGWTKNGGQFVPMPATYLNQRRWEDESERKAEERKWI